MMPTFVGALYQRGQWHRSYVATGASDSLEASLKGREESMRRNTAGRISSTCGEGVRTLLQRQWRQPAAGHVELRSESPVVEQAA
jgi:hypothetical protein